MNNFIEHNDNKISTVFGAIVGSISYMATNEPLKSLAFAFAAGFVGHIGNTLAKYIITKIRQKNV